MRPPHSGYVATIDGTSVMPAERARTLARGMFIAGFCMLPWLWLVNTWLFWPHARPGAETTADPTIRRFARRSAVGAAVFAVLLLPWAMGFVFAGAQFVGDHAWEMLAVTRWAATNTQF